MRLQPRAQACTWMSLAMAFHFGGYEFARSGALALFTSSEVGFAHPSAYPLAVGVVTPLSVLFLYCYGVILKNYGPRAALNITKLFSVMALTACTLLVKVFGASPLSKVFVAVLFVFQNSYAHLLYTQQWSFLGSVMTPTEGTKWFSTIGGISSLVCTFTAAMVHPLTALVGLEGLLLGTALSLSISFVLADLAYRIAEQVSTYKDCCNFVRLNPIKVLVRFLRPTTQNGFDPRDALQRKKEKVSENKSEKEHSDGKSLFSKTAFLFRRVPTLAALFGEVVSFQSLSTVLNVCFVRQLKDGLPCDNDRASFTGRLYACVNGSAALMQFLVLPLLRKYLEPKWVYRLMPTLLLPILVYSSLQVSNLWIAAAALFSLKTLDYSLRNVVNEMVYQPLDFESRYVGKEVIGVFANRFGKSGMSLILSLVTPLGMRVTHLAYLSVAVSTIWASCSFWLSQKVLLNADAEKRVKERQQKSIS